MGCFHIACLDVHVSLTAKEGERVDTDPLLRHVAVSASAHAQGNARLVRFPQPLRRNVGAAPERACQWDCCTQPKPFQFTWLD
eukprot:4538045-Alexandrium_andersonii.AAC.1